MFVTRQVVQRKATARTRYIEPGYLLSHPHRSYTGGGRATTTLRSRADSGRNACGGVYAAGLAPPKRAGARRMRRYAAPNNVGVGHGGARRSKENRDGVRETEEGGNFWCHHVLSGTSVCAVCFVPPPSLFVAVLFFFLSYPP